MGKQASSHRLLSLDIVRGITVAAMIMVNNGYGNSFTMLRHAEWNGLSLSDFVFPFFLFIMGVSIFLSYSRRGFTFNSRAFMKICKRTVLLIAFGLALNWFAKWLYTDLATSFEQLRYWAVLQRIAVCYFLVSVFALTVNHRFTIPVAIGLLVCYTFILVYGNGMINDREQNLLWKVDESLFGENHLYRYSSIDPEGLVSTISSLANVLFGFYCAMMMSKATTVISKVNVFFTVGTILIFAGFLINFSVPYNKTVWSPSFACITSGACALLTGLMMKWIDAEGRRGPWVSFFEVFGINALILYISSEFLAIVFGKLGVSQALFGFVSAVIPVDVLASLAYATIFMLINWLIGFLLWRRRIIIKI